ncbi:uncharacterized protein LODBEIA_P44830 [Lodderomyces beijingensis]|uniref:Nitrogen regulatory protein areA GATA-like domain-containing protein n=1 Tax=Lodderomyces beijingensis TaxID=1775926 RepID=A0ABP0ZQ32_9ASCO
MSGEVFTGGATTSQHVDAQDDDHFENTTFKLKRTRSLGLLDEFIPDKAKEQALEEGKVCKHPNSEQSPSLSSNRDDDESKFSDNSRPLNSIDTDTNNSYYNSLATSGSNQSTSVSSSPSPVASPTNPPAVQSPELIPYDDTDLAVEPSRHVDYLSHQWNVSDISKSWRYVISKKRDVANAARLENASWRTWAQRRSNLKTISPEVVNWSKESDVTWLYGPILNNNSNNNRNTNNNNNGGSNNNNNQSPGSEKNATSNDENKDIHSIHEEPLTTVPVAGDLSVAKKANNSNAPKPILKRRTVEESIISHSNLLKLKLATSLHQKKQDQKAKHHAESSHHTNDSNPDEFFDYNALSNKLNSQYSNKNPTDNAQVARFQNLLNNSNSSSLSTIKQDEDLMDADSGNYAEDVAPSHFQAGPKSRDEVASKKDRHIHFNDEVKQCIAYDASSDDEYEDYSDSGNEDDTEVYDDYNDQVNDNLIRSHFYQRDGDEGDGNKDGKNDDNDNNDVNDDDDDDDEDDDDDDDDDDDGGFFLQVKSSSGAPLKFSNSNTSRSASIKSADTASETETDSRLSGRPRSYKTIHLLPSTILNYGSDDETSDEDYPYTSSVSHNVNNDVSRGYDYYYDYNTVYTCDPTHPTLQSYQNTDVIDVPENLEIGSNINYELVDDKDLPPAHELAANSSIESGTPKQSPVLYNSPSPTYNAADAHHKQSPFQLSDSEGDSDDDADCLSIGTRRSSQGIIESVLHQGHLSELRESAQKNANANEGATKSTSSEAQSQPQEQEQKQPQSQPQSQSQSQSHYRQLQPQPEPQPVNEPVSSINPRHTSNSLSKQSRSSNSLSQSFLGGGSLESTAQDKALSKSFFGAPSTSSSTTNESESKSEPKPEKPTLARTLSNTKPKSSLSEAIATSENAFGVSPQSSSASSPVSKSHDIKQSAQPPRKGAFLLDNGSESESESEDEGMVIGARPGSRGQSYTTLSHLADKNGIRNVNGGGVQPAPNEQEGDEEKNRNIIGRTKGLAKHFFG